MRTLIALTLCLVSLGEAHGKPKDLGDVLRALQIARDPEKRLALVEDLVGLDTSRSAGALAYLVRRDPVLEVRVAAATGLGRMEADSVPEHLLALVQEGGPRAVRHALAESLIRKQDLTPALLEMIASTRTDALAKGLVIEALATHRDDVTRAALLRLAAEGSDHLRGEALRALADRPDAHDDLVNRLGAILRTNRGKDALLQALDLVESLDDVAFRPLVDRLKTFLEPEVQRAADHLAAKLAHIEAVQRSRRAVLEGYGAPTPPPPPLTRTRYDLVFAIDVTGSTVVDLDDMREKIRSEIALLERLGCNLRVGVVGYRFWKDISLNVPRMEVLPLTHDSERVKTFLDEIRSRGPDSQGADVTNGLTQALARMGWRWNAHRFVVLLADSHCHEPDSAKLVTMVHFRADQTRTRVCYVLRTRRKVPPDIIEIAKLGGTGTVELMK